MKQYTFMSSYIGIRLRLKVRIMAISIHSYSIGILLNIKKGLNLQ